MGVHQVSAFPCENSGQGGARSRTIQVRSSSNASANSCDARTFACARAYSSSDESESNTIRLSRWFVGGLLAFMSKRCTWLQGVCNGVRASMFKHNRYLRPLSSSFFEFTELVADLSGF